MSGGGEWTMYPRRWVESEKSGSVQSDRQFTIVPYNILCDKYIRNNYQYIPKSERYMDCRGHRILTELKTMDADVIALQEVSREHFEDQLEQAVPAMGYELAVATGGEYKAGQLTAWKKGVFKLLHQEEHQLADLAMEDIQKCSLSDEEKKALRDWFEVRNLILVTQLEHIPSGNKLLIGNIHLSWSRLEHPVMQTVQAAAGLRLLSRLSEKLDTAPVIMLGDFNSPVDFAPYEFMKNGRLSKETVEKLERGEGRRVKDTSKHELTLLSVLPEAPEHSHSLASAYSTVMTQEPEITNSDDGDRDAMGIAELCLDYLWFDTRTLGALGALQTPPRDAIMKHTSLPSPLFPSDHLPLKFKLHFL